VETEKLKQSTETKEIITANKRYRNHTVLAIHVAREASRVLHCTVADFAVKSQVLRQLSFGPNQLSVRIAKAARKRTRSKCKFWKIKSWGIPLSCQSLPHNRTLCRALPNPFSFRQCVLKIRSHEWGKRDSTYSWANWWLSLLPRAVLLFCDILHGPRLAASSREWAEGYTENRMNREYLCTVS
jgi:hypothetical protein